MLAVARGGPLMGINVTRINMLTFGIGAGPGRVLPAR